MTWNTNFVEKYRVQRNVIWTGRSRNLVWDLHTVGNLWKWLERSQLHLSSLNAWWFWCSFGEDSAKNVWRAIRTKQGTWKQEKAIYLSFTPPPSLTLQPSAATIPDLVLTQCLRSQLKYLNKSFFIVRIGIFQGQFPRWR